MDGCELEVKYADCPAKLVSRHYYSFKNLLNYTHNIFKLNVKLIIIAVASVSQVLGEFKPDH